MSVEKVQEILNQRAKTIAPAELDEVLEVAEKEDEPPKPDELTIMQLRLLLEQKLLAEAKKTSGDRLAPPSKAPGGLAWLFNRGSAPFIWQYDALVYELDGHDMQLFPERVARHGKKRSLVSLDPVANTALFQCVLESDPKFGIPLKIVNRTELIDRTTDANPLGVGSPVPTRLVALQVGGAAESLLRRSDQFVELEP